MSKHPAPSAESFGHHAALAVKKHFHYAMKFQTDVLRDSDPENLHQMRVGLRRLRTAIRVFHFGVEVPADGRNSRIRKIMHILGAVRDLDVLKGEILEELKPLLDEAERSALDAAIATLDKERDVVFAKMRKLFTASLYKSFKQSYQDWLKSPRYTENSHYPMAGMAPDILLPLLSQLFLHPGWLLGTVSSEAGIQVRKHIGYRSLHGMLYDEQEVLHDLRKQIKRVRYQSEFFTKLYPPVFAAWIKELKRCQDILGWLNDTAVLHDFLRSRVHENWEQELPTLNQYIRQEQLRVWRQWQTIQQRYLNHDLRNKLRMQILQQSPPAAATAEKKTKSGVAGKTVRVSGAGVTPPNRQARQKVATPHPAPAGLKTPPTASVVPASSTKADSRPDKQQGNPGRTTAAEKTKSNNSSASSLDG